MIAVKFFTNKNKHIELLKTIENIAGFMRNNLSLKNTKTLRSSNDTEIISGQKESFNDNQITVELVIKKTIVINKEDLNSAPALDKHITEIKHFCKQAREIEKITYTPLTLRNL